MQYELLGYGATMRYEKRRPAEGFAVPAGEGDPPWDHWHVLLLQCQTFDAFRSVWVDARSELQAWKCRAEPAPEGETLDQMQTRIIDEGEGWTPKQVAMAFRCTPTLVRNTRLERERNPETGRAEGSLEHAKDLLGRGLTLRQVAILTGIPKSTLHRLSAERSRKVASGHDER